MIALLLSLILFKPETKLEAMVRQDTKSSRITPKGTKPSVRSEAQPEVVTEEPASIAVPIIMFGSFAIGAGILLTNYLVESETLGTPSNWYLLIGLGLVLVGIVSSTRLR